MPFEHLLLLILENKVGFVLGNVSVQIFQQHKGDCTEPEMATSGKKTEQILDIKLIPQATWTDL